MKMPAKKTTEDEPQRLSLSASSRREGGICCKWTGRRRDSFQDLEAAQSAGLEIKKCFPILQVAIYDRVSSSHTLVQSPAKKDSARE